MSAARGRLRHNLAISSCARGGHRLWWTIDADPARTLDAAAGLSYKEAAKVLGTRERTIMSRLFRACRQVAEALGPR